MARKCVFLDIDGTLTQNPIGIPDSAIQAIHQARENGHIICICTGRPRPDVDEEIINIGFDALICSCGAYVEVDQKVIVLKAMPTHHIETLLAYIRKNAIGVNLEGAQRSYLDTCAMAFFTELFMQNEGANSELIRSYMASIHMLPIEACTKEDFKQVLKVSIFSENEERLLNIAPHLHDDLQFIMHPLEGGTIYNGEISMKHITKATGIDHVLSYFHCDIEDTIAIGDSMNDVSMIAHCAIGICMDNGADDLKKISDDVCPSVDQDGIYHAFKKYHLIS